MADTKSDAKAAPTKAAAEQRVADHGLRREQHLKGTGETATTLKEANEKGFFGEKVDPTPNEHYTTPDPHTNPRPYTGPEVA
jgi:hypothetical protein